MEVKFHAFFTSPLGGDDRSTLGKTAPGTCWIGGWVSPRACR